MVAISMSQTTTSILFATVFVGQTETHNALIELEDYSAGENQKN